MGFLPGISLAHFLASSAAKFLIGLLMPHSKVRSFLSASVFFFVAIWAAILAARGSVVHFASSCSCSSGFGDNYFVVGGIVGPDTVEIFS